MKILIADDYTTLGELMKTYIEKNSEYKDILIAKSSKEQLEIMEREEIDLVITDNERKNEDTSGFDIIKEYEKRNSKIKFIVISSTHKMYLINRETGELPKNIVAYLNKPHNWEDTISVIKQAEKVILSEKE